MKPTEIIKQAKCYFGQDKSLIKAHVLGTQFNGEEGRRWQKDMSAIVVRPYSLSYKLYDDVIEAVKENRVDEIDWNWIGDLSWTVEIVLNPEVDKVYDWDKKLALKCGGIARILTLYISDMMPCYTYDLYYMEYNRKANYYEFGPIADLTDEEEAILQAVKSLLQSKGLTFVAPVLATRKFKDLYSDIHSSGNASLFDALFSDVYGYTTEIKRVSDKTIVEKNGGDFSWTERYHGDGSLKERIECRRTVGGDRFTLTLDGAGQIKHIEISPKWADGVPHEIFTLDIERERRKSQKKAQKQAHSRMARTGEY